MWQLKHGPDAKRLMRSTSAGVLLLALTGCSDGFSRLDTGLTTASVSQPSNQDLIIRKQAGAQPTSVPIQRQIDQPYPGDLPARTPRYDAVAAGSDLVRLERVERSALPMSTGSVAKTVAVARKTPPIQTTPTVPADDAQSFVPSVPKAARRTPEVEAQSTRVRKATSDIPVVPPLRTAQPSEPRKIGPAPKATTPTKNGAGVASTAHSDESVSKNVNSGTYTVVAGDTVYGIARKVGVPPQDVVRWNGLADSAIRPGQVLLVSGDARKPRSAVPTAVADVRKIEPIVTGSIAKSADATRTAVAIPAVPKKAAFANKSVASSGPGFAWPARGRIVSRFGDTLNGSMNDGVDLEMPSGTPVRAVADGSVVFASSLEGYGNLVLVRHADNWVSAYAHGSAMKVTRGQKVTQGQTVALSGATGSAASPRLHFELRRNSTPVDPVRHLPK